MGANSSNTNTKKEAHETACDLQLKGDHAWFYETESARRNIAHLNVSSNESINQRAMVAHDFESTRSEYRTWQEWYEGETKPGCYDTENLHACRLTFRQHNINPTVKYNNGELTSLHVHTYKQHIYKTKTIRRVTTAMERRVEPCWM